MAPQLDEGIWLGVARLIDRAREHPQALFAHGLHVLAARLARERGCPVRVEFAEAESRSALIALTVPRVLARVRTAYDGAILLFKGPEASAVYPDPVCRPFGDVDILVPNAAELQRALIAAGFEELSDPPWVPGTREPTTDPFAPFQHFRPVCWPGLPIPVEVHRRPNWPRWIAAPRIDELFAVAEPSQVANGFLTLPRPHHALVLAAHAWVHGPLAAARGLVDVAAMADGLDRKELRALARSWEMERLWATTIDTTDVLLADGERSWAEHLWARHLRTVRERTVLEQHVATLLSPFWGYPPGSAGRAVARRVGSILLPAPGDSPRTKLYRVRGALRRPLTAKSEHDRRLGPAARRIRRSRR